MEISDSTRPTSNQEFLKVSCEILQKALWEAANLLTKGMTFCLAIVAGLVGYVVSQKLDHDLTMFVLGAGIVTLVLFSILAGHWISALHTAAKCLERLVAELSDKQFETSPMPDAFGKFRSVGRTFAVCAILEVMLLICGMTLLLLR